MLLLLWFLFIFSGCGCGASHLETCSAGAIFLSVVNNLSYKINFSYDCSDSDLNLKLKKLKKKNPDPFVSWFLKNERKRRQYEGEELSGSGHHSDYDDEDEEGEIIEPSIVEKYTVPMEKTPYIGHTHFSSQIVSSVVVSVVPVSKVFYTSSLIQSIKPDRPFLGSGDDAVMATPIILSPTSTEKNLIKMQKKVLTAGVEWEEEFDDDCGTVKPFPWMEIIKKNNKSVLLALPSNEEISDYDFQLICTHSTYSIFYSVRQRQRSRNWNHLFKIEFSTLHRNLHHFSNFLKKLNERKQPDDLVVVGYSMEFSVGHLTYINESLVIEGGRLGHCPIEELKKVYNSLNQKINKTLGNFKISEVSIAPYPGHVPCDRQDISVVMETAVTPPPSINFPPSIKNQIDEIRGSVGSFLVYKIPGDFCYDPEDGERVELGLKNLKTFQPWGEEFWVQFDGKNREVYGLPMTPGSHSALITCTDSSHLSTQDSIEIIITTPTKPPKYAAEFSLHFESIPWKPPAIRKFLEKLSSLLSREIVVKSFSTSNGHVQFKWFNGSNPSEERELNEIRKILWSEEGGVNRGVKVFFGPEFNLSDSGGVVPLNSLLGANTPIEVSKEFDFPKGEEENAEVLEEDLDWRVYFKNGTPYLTTYIIPSILIALMILVAMIIACLLSRKKTPPPLEYKNQKIAGGVPVIFQDELEQSLVARQQAPQPRPPSYNNSVERRNNNPPQYAPQQPVIYPDPYSKLSQQQQQQYCYQPPRNFQNYDRMKGMRVSRGADCYVPP